jgi:cystathionine gamma-lyase
VHDSTRIIRSTLTPATPGAPLHVGPVFASAFHVPGDPDGVPYTYARSHNPTYTVLEKTIALMESGPGYRAQALVFASGMAAVAAVFGAVLKPGDVCVIPSNSYFTARVLMQEHFAKIGVEVRSAPTADDAQGDLLEGAKLLWLETPSNPGMEMCDIAALCERAHAAGALVAVDNTTATPLGQSPLALGADFSVVSDTKSMTGHGDLLLGHVATRDMEHRALIDSWRTLTGAVPGPMEAWLAERSLATLPLRLERSCENAQRIAEFLEGRPGVEAVYYPGLSSHPAHELAKRQMKFFGPVVSFILPTKAAAVTFLAQAKLITDATSFGAVYTTAERRNRWGGDAIPDGFIRLSAGCEHIEDLLEDFAQALDATR